MSETQLNLQKGTGVQIRKATPADREALLELSRLVFHETGAVKAAELSPEFWDWQFARLPSQRTEIWVAEYNGRILGQFPANVIRLHWGQRELLAAMVIDLMVDPRHRDKNLYIKMCRAANAAMGETGIALVLGLPNKNSYPAAVRFLKYKLVSQVPVLLMPLRMGRLLNKAKFPKGLSGPLGAVASAGLGLLRFPGPRAKSVAIREVASFPSEIDEFWQRASAAHKILSVRDGRYLNWRYSQCPTRSYRIHIAESDGRMAGYLVRRSFEKDALQFGAIMDVLVEPGRKDVLRALLASAVRAFRQEKMDAIVALMLRDRFYYPALRRGGFYRIPEKLNPRPFHFVCRLLWPELPAKEFHASENWFLTLGDFDVY